MVSNWLAIWANSSSASGSLALLDGGDGDGDLGGLALAVATDELRLEGRRLTGGQGLERLVDALEQVAGADLVGDAGGRVDLVVTDAGGEVDLREVAGLRRTVDRHERAEAGAEVLQFLFDLVVRHLDGVDGELVRGVVRQVELRADVDLEGEDEVAGEVRDVRQLGDVGLGTAEDAQLLLFDRLAVEVVDGVTDGVVQDLAAADALVDDRRRDLALAEAGDVDLLGDVLVGVVDARLEIVRRHVHGELDAGVAHLVDGAGGQGMFSCWLTFVWSVVLEGPGRGDRI